MTEQEIKIWIEDEAKKYPFQMTSMAWKSGASAMYNLLSPQIQELKDEVDSLIKQQTLVVNANVKFEDQLKQSLQLYQNQVNKIESQQKEIERLKAENGRLKDFVRVVGNGQHGELKGDFIVRVRGLSSKILNSETNDERSVATEDAQSGADDKQKN